jgi:hypothetical protein
VGSSVGEYTYGFRNLMTRADPAKEMPEWQLVDKYISGLESEVQLFVRMDPSIQTLDQAIKKATEAERAYESTSNKKRIYLTKEAKEEPEAITQPVLTAQIENMKKEITNSIAQFVKNTTCPLCYKENPDHKVEDCPSRSIKRQYPSNNKKCYKCDKEGHHSRDCQSPPKCFQCGKLGHIARNCGQNDYQKSQGQCDKCGRYGHSKKQCRVPTCYDCGKIGHAKNKCPKNNQYNNQQTKKVYYSEQEEEQPNQTEQLVHLIAKSFKEAFGDLKD